MRKLVTVPALALLIVACSEGPVSPALDAPQFIAQHESINPPVIESTTVVDGDVRIDWSWVDADDGWDLVSFKVKRNGVDVPGEPQNAKPYTAGTTLQRDHTDLGVAEGLHEYCIEVMAKYYSTAHEATITNHSRTCTWVAVGDVQLPAFRFVHVAAAHSSTETQADVPLALSRNGTFTIWAVLYEGNVRIDNCTTLPVADVSATISFSAPGIAAASVAAEECSYNGAAQRHRYKFSLPNLHNSQAAAGTIEFKVNGVTVTTYDFTTS